MKELTCYSDAGGCLIGNKNKVMLVPNIGGDGKTKVSIYDSYSEFYSHRKHDKLNLLYGIEGKINIYEYDCMIDAPWFTNNIIETIDGEFMVFQGFKEVIFVHHVKS